MDAFKDFIENVFGAAGVAVAQTPRSCSHCMGNDVTEYVGLWNVTLEYTWAEIIKATKDLAFARILGSGRTGTVYHGRLEEGTDVAIKVICQPLDKDFEDEVRLLSRCHHPNVVMLLGYAVNVSPQQRALVYELLPGGNALAKLHAEAPYPALDRLRTAVQACAGLAHLHKLRPEVFHRDITTKNILFTAGGVAKIADFGLACASRHRDQRWSSERAVCGTPGYSAPEYAEKGIATEGSEVYSMGMVLIELLTAQAPARLNADGTGYHMLLDKVAAGPADAKACILELLDPRARWPTKTAIGVTVFALLCINQDVVKRPCFLEMATVLESLANSMAALVVDEELAAGDVASTQIPLRPDAAGERGRAPPAEDPAPPGGAEAGGGSVTHRISPCSDGTEARGVVVTFGDPPPPEPRGEGGGDWRQHGIYQLDSLPKPAADSGSVSTKPSSSSGSISTMAEGRGDWRQQGIYPVDSLPELVPPGGHDAKAAEGCQEEGREAARRKTAPELRTDALQDEEVSHDEPSSGSTSPSKIHMSYSAPALSMGVDDFEDEQEELLPTVASSGDVSRYAQGSSKRNSSHDSGEEPLNRKSSNDSGPTVADGAEAQEGRRHWLQALKNRVITPGGGAEAGGETPVWLQPWKKPAALDDTPHGDNSGSSSTEVEMEPAGGGGRRWLQSLRSRVMAPNEAAAALSEACADMEVDSLNGEAREGRRWLQALRGRVTSQPETEGPTWLQQWRRPSRAEAPDDAEARPPAAASPSEPTKDDVLEPIQQSTSRPEIEDWAGETPDFSTMGKLHHICDWTE